MKSSLYTGTLAHTRLAPKLHHFSYELYMMFLDLDELSGLSSWAFGVERLRPLSFFRKDFLGDKNRPLKDCVWERVEEKLGPQNRGPVRLLTQVRTFGYVFNPVSFYYCFDHHERLVAVVSEITNTPWKERHAYVVSADEAGAGGDFDKDFHVSPFFPMEQRYRWRFDAPSERLQVSMANFEGTRCVFRAGLALRRSPLSITALARILVRHPLMSLGVHAAIYYQALRLYLNRIPFFTHPAKGEIQ